jgi:hypothetical protein
VLGLILYATPLIVPLLVRWLYVRCPKRRARPAALTDRGANQRTHLEIRLVLGRATAVLSTALVAGAIYAGEHAAATLASTYGCQIGALPGQTPPPMPSRQRLLFGIAPYGVAGTILPVPPSPESASKQLASLERLGGGHPFVLHFYTAYTGNSAVDERGLQATRSLFADMRTHGLFSELVVRYAPGDGGGPAAVAGYAHFIRRVVDVLGPDPSFVNLQVTNEVNQALTESTSDGAYSGARDALIEGVEAAKDEAIRDGYRDLGIGFNWFYRLDPSTEESFWTYLGTHGGAAFDRAVDWVGLDAYPGTYFPPSPGAEGDGMINALSVLRNCFMPAAGLGLKVQIHVTENGWPTGNGRPESLQATALQQMVDAVWEYRGNYGVTAYSWYDLSDDNSSSPDFEGHWGLENDNYQPKPAFATYQSLIASLDTQADPTRAVPSIPLASIKITKVKINSKRHTAKFSFTATGTASSFQCALVRKSKHHKKPRPHFKSCKSPKSYSHLKPARYTFEVRPVTAAGPGTPATSSFNVG